MDEIQLIAPSAQYEKQILAFRREINEAHDKDAFAGCCHLGNCETLEEWLEQLHNRENPETCPRGGVPSNVYLAVRCSDDCVVGVIDLRHHIDHPILGLWGGHIGYSVRPSQRGKGYATEMLRLNLKKCRERGLEKVLITCSERNSASEKVIVANGGVLEKTISVDGENIRRYWITL